MKLCAIKSEILVFTKNLKKQFYEFVHIVHWLPMYKEKTMANKKFWLGMLAMVLVFGMTVVGCATRILDLTIASTQSLDLSRVGEFKRSASVVKGTSTMITRILIFDVKIGKIDMKKAIDSALYKIPGAVALVNFRLDRRPLNFLIFALDQYVASGSALVDPNIISLGNDEEFLPELVTFNETGEIIERVQITQDEYNQYLAVAEYKIIQ